MRTYDVARHDVKVPFGFSPPSAPSTAFHVCGTETGSPSSVQPPPESDVTVLPDFSMLTLLLASTMNGGFPSPL